MHEKTEMLHELCSTLMEELEDVNKKIDKAGGMSAGDLETVDKLTHALKSVKTTIAMMEADEDGYSGGYMPRWYPYSYADGMGGNMGGGKSYARGRGSNAKRDSMGRYSSRGYSRNDGYSYADSMDSLLTEMREMLPGLSDEKRRKAEQLMDELRR